MKSFRDELSAWHPKPSQKLSQDTEQNGWVADGNCRSLSIQYLIATQADRELARQAVSRTTSIPDVICQFWDNAFGIPADVRACMATWQVAVDQGFDILLFDDSSALALIEADFSSREVEAFRQCHHPAMRSDYFRLAFLYRHGGWYVDADERLIGKRLHGLTHGASLCLQPLCLETEGATRMVPAAEFTMALPGRPGWYFYINNNPIMAAPGHPFVRIALDRATDLILAAARSGTRPDINGTTGPENVTRALVACFLSETDAPLGELNLLLDWTSICHSPWELSYRSDDRNWRNNADYYGIYG